MVCLANEIHTAKIWQSEYKIKPVWLFGFLGIYIGQTLAMAFNRKVVLSQVQVLVLSTRGLKVRLPLLRSSFFVGAT